MEAEINSFTRKSKRYRTKYFDALGELFKRPEATDKHPKEGAKNDCSKEIKEE